MDYSKFLDENFDVKEWVNSAFKSSKETVASKDQYATTLVMKLQMFIQEVNNVIEETCQQAIQNLPRVMRELEAVRQESSLLQEQMTMVKQDIQKVEHDTAQSMQILLKLDSIKTRMKAASDALQEADNWTTLSADVEEVFQSGDIHAISEKLVGMQQSLHMLTDVPDYTERCNLLENLKNRLEAMLSPQLVAAFNAQSLEGAQMYVRIFKDIDRLPQLIKYYHKCHKSQLVEQWKTIVENAADDTVVEWISEFYDILLSTWHSQIKWCSQVFQEPVPVVCILLVETLQTLDPSLPSSVATYLQNQSEALPALITLKEVSDRFAKSLDVAIESHAEGNMSSNCIRKLASTVYVSYRPYIKQYGDFENAKLQAELDKIPLDHEDVIDCVQLLSDSVSKLFAVADQSNERCVQFTSGCGYVSLLDALQKYLLNYVRELERVLVNLREKCQLDSTSTDSEDWTLFQHSLRIVQTSGELIMHLDELDQSLISSIVTALSHYYQPGSPSKDAMKGQNPFHYFPDLLLDSEKERSALSDFYLKLEEGETPSVLTEVKQQLYKLSENVLRFSFDIVFAPLRRQLSQVGTMEIWTSQSAGGALTSNLPTFSLSPQEYITKIGQYLMTLPQHVEPFTAHDHPALAVALKHGKLPYTSKQDMPDHLADLWLESTAQGTMHHYLEQILKIHELTGHATKQLVTDIDYLSNVLEDLGLQPTESMKDMVSLLKATKDDYSEVAEKMPLRVASAVANMRNLSLD